MILDNAFGSGTFLLAAHLENRRFVGIEKNQENLRFKSEEVDLIDIAVSRLQRHGANLKISRRS